MEKLLTPKEVSGYLKISLNTLAIWRMKGRGMPFVRVGKKIRYRASDIEAYLANKQ